MKTLSIDAFEAGHVAAETFDHGAHVYVGWLYVRQFPIDEAIARFETALRRLVITLGAARKYHASITRFFLLLITERDRPNESWPEFQERNADLLQGAESILERYYSPSLLFSDEARKRFIPPDRIALKTNLRSAPLCSLEWRSPPEPVADPA